MHTTCDLQLAMLMTACHHTNNAETGRYIGIRWLSNQLGDYDNWKHSVLLCSFRKAQSKYDSIDTKM